MNGMFGNNYPQQQLQTYNSDQVASQFTTLHFGLGAPYDGLTAQVAKFVVNEIQNTAVNTNHPIRLGMFNIMSRELYNNNDFVYLLKVVMHRLTHGIVNREFNSINEVASAVIPRVVKACSCGMAATDPAFMQTLAQADAIAAREQAGTWQYLEGLTAGTQPYIPFNQLAAANQFQTVASSTREAIESGSALLKQPVGNFSGSGEYMVSTPGGNNGGLAKGKYGRKLEQMNGALRGSMQQAMADANAMIETQQQQAPVRPIKGMMRVGTEDALAFDSNLTDFTKSLDDEYVPQTPVSEPDPEPLFSLTMGGITINAIREIPAGDSMVWFSNEFQRHHPVVCSRTHRIRYFETNVKTVFAVMHPLTNEEKDLTMDYNAHGIDPTKGHPDPELPKAPVREEAKVLYADKKELKLSIKVHDVTSMEEDINGCVRNVLVTAGLSDEKHDAHVKKAITNIPVLYSDVTNAEDDLIVARKIAASTTFAEAGALLKHIHNPQLRDMIDKDLVKAINTMCKAELSIPVWIDSFANDAGQLVEGVRAAPGFGDFFADAIAKQQVTILRNNVIVTPALEMKEHAQATLAVTGVDLPDEKLKSILFMQRNAMVVWINFTDDELALTLPEVGAGHIQESSYAALHGIVKAVFDNSGKHSLVSDFRLVTVDNVRYDLHRSLIGPEIYLISKSGVELK